MDTNRDRDDSGSGQPRRLTGAPALHTETGRVEAFSDGVLAVAITLLVLDLRPPAHKAGGLLRGLLTEWPAYLGYVTSFLSSG